jgi:hypothetical protein
MIGAAQAITLAGDVYALANGKPAKRGSTRALAPDYLV